MRRTQEYMLKTRLFYAVVIGLGVLGTVVGVALSGVLFGGVSTTELRDGLVESCERNGNPLREAVTTLLEDQIAQTQNLDYSEFFPTVPEERLDALIEMQNDKRRALLRTIQPVDCQALYR